MLALSIVEHLDVIEDVRSRRLPVRIDPALDAFALQQLEKALSDRIVMAVTPATHAGDQVVGLEKVLPVITGVLTALIRMNDDFSHRLASPHRHQQRPHDQVRFHARLHRPADHLSREQIQHHGQKQPTFMRSDIGDVGHPGGVRLRDIELALQVVRRDNRRTPALVSLVLLVADLGLDVILMRQPFNAAFTARLAQIPQVVVNLAVTIHATAFQPRLLDQAQQSPVLDGAWRVRLEQPGVVSAGMNSQHSAHDPDTMLMAMRLDEFILYPHSPAKYFAAFFRMSRSSSARRSAALSRRISFC